MGNLDCLGWNLYVVYLFDRSAFVQSTVWWQCDGFKFWYRLLHRPLLRRYSQTDVRVKFFITFCFLNENMAFDRVDMVLWWLWEVKEFDNCRTSYFVWVLSFGFALTQVLVKRIECAVEYSDMQLWFLKLWFNWLYWKLCCVNFAFQPS